MERSEACRGTGAKAVAASQGRARSAEEVALPLRWAHPAVTAETPADWNSFVRTGPYGGLYSDVQVAFLLDKRLVFVTGKGFTLDKVFDYLGRASMVRYMAGSPL